VQNACLSVFTQCTALVHEGYSTVHMGKMRLHDRFHGLMSYRHFKSHPYSSWNGNLTALLALQPFIDYRGNILIRELFKKRNERNLAILNAPKSAL